MITSSKEVSDKLNVVVANADHNLDLISIWLDDKTRPWDTYSKEQSRPQWDFGIHRSYLDSDPVTEVPKK